MTLKGNPMESEREQYLRVEKAAAVPAWWGSNICFADNQVIDFRRLKSASTSLYESQSLLSYPLQNFAHLRRLFIMSGIFIKTFHKQL
jgi:hypothetical protein